MRDASFAKDSYQGDGIGSATFRTASCYISAVKMYGCKDGARPSTSDNWQCPDKAMKQHVCLPVYPSRRMKWTWIAKHAQVSLVLSDISIYIFLEEKRDTATYIYIHIERERERVRKKNQLPASHALEQSKAKRERERERELLASHPPEQSKAKQRERERELPASHALEQSKERERERTACLPCPRAKQRERERENCLPPMP